MLNKLLFHRFPNIKSWLTRLQYEMVSTFDKDKNATNVQVTRNPATAQCLP